MRAAIYARYSSKLQSAASVEDQIRLCADRAERDGYRIVGVYADRAISGANLMTRPGIKDLLADAKEKKFDVVISEALDRLSRDQEDIAAIYKRLTYAEIQLLTLAEGQVEELHIGLKGTMNALFLKDLAAKIRRGQHGRVVSGYSAGGLSYGYDVKREFDSDGNPIPGNLCINRHQANVVRRIFEAYVAGKSPRKIAAELNRECIPAPRGGQWNASTINGHRARRNGILQNELYAGRRIFNRVRMVKDPSTGKRVSRINPKDEWIVTEVPDLRIVSQKLWDQAQTLKARYSKQPAHKSRRPKRLLSGLLNCGVCGGSYTLVRPGKYGCSARREKGTCENGRQVSATRLEDRVLSGIKHHFDDPELLAEFIDEFDRELRRIEEASNNGRAGTEKLLVELNERIDRIVNAISEGTDTPSMRRALIELEDKKLEVEGSLRTRPVSSNHQISLNPADLYRQKISRLHTELNANDEIRREAASLLRTLIDRIVLHPSEKPRKMKVEVFASAEDLLLFGADSDIHDQRMIKVVAEEGLEPPTRGL